MLGKLCIISLIIFVITIVIRISWESENQSSFDQEKNEYEKNGTHNTYFYVVGGIGISLLAFFIFLILTILFW